MKLVKILGLLPVAATALIAFASTASAEVTGGTTIHGQSSGASSLTGSITITCQKSTISGEVTTNDANEVSGPVTTLSHEECGNHTVTTVQKGTIKVTDSDGTTGTVTSNGAEVTVLLHSAFLGTVHCIYKTTNTDIGTFTESNHNPGTGSHTTATIHASASLERVSTDFGCGSDSTLECTFEITGPDILILH